MTSSPSIGVRMAGVGSAVPDRILANADFEKMMDTSDEWIRQRTGIRERRVVAQDKGEGTISLSVEALSKALDDAGMVAKDLDLIILASVTTTMTCPSGACIVSQQLGAEPAAAFDLVAACSGFVYASNVADSLIRSGRHKAVGVIGCDTMSTVMDYDDRSVSILFGDAAGAMVLTADEDPNRGCIYQRLHADGNGWHSLYMPRKEVDVVDGAAGANIKLGNLRMNGREIYKFAVSKFTELLKESLAQCDLSVEDIRQYICHQSNARIIESAVSKLNLPEDRVYVNIDRFGNSSAGSVGLCLDQLWQADKIDAGDLIMLIAFGGGMTWASGIWRV
ncbi:MAG: beta-ketoacyl-ACP synthase III [Planctomycetota bacterium]